MFWRILLYIYLVITGICFIYTALVLMAGNRRARLLKAQGRTIKPEYQITAVERFGHSLLTFILVTLPLYNFLLLFSYMFTYEQVLDNLYEKIENKYE